MIWTVGHEEWGPRLLYLSAACFVLSLICFFWPLLKRRLWPAPPQIQAGQAEKDPYGSIHVPSTQYTYTAVPGAHVSSMTNAEIGDRMIDAAWHVNNHIEHERKHKTETEIVDYYHKEYAPIVIWLYEEAKRRRFSDDLLDRHYQKPKKISNLQGVGQRLGALGRAMKEHPEAH